MKKSIFKKYIKNKYFIGGAIILIIVAYFTFFRGGKTQTIEFATATIGNVMEKVSVTGKISPVGKADLAFEKGGVIKTINFKVGDKIKKGQVIASLDSAGDAANMASAEAKLNDLTRSLNPQEFAVEQSKVNTARISLANAKQESLNAARTAYVQAQSAITNYADALFDNPQSVNPVIKIRTQSQNEQNVINSARITASDALTKWRIDIDTATSTNDAANIISKANLYVNITKNFMSSLSTIVNNLNIGNSGLSQTVIDTYISSMNSGLTLSNQSVDSISGAKANLENASSAYDQADSNFILKKTGSSAQTIAAQTATVAAYRAEYEKDRIISPINGIVTRIDPNVGEFVSVGKTSFSIIDEGTYKIEAYVAEADIAKISVDDYASTTLDAYGQNIDFPAVVTMVDPAETVLEGVPTYKVTLQFVTKDGRIRSGMTANLEILTNRRDNVVTIPWRAVVGTSGEKIVRVLKTDGKTFTSRPIVTGLKGSEGVVEVVVGVNEGEKVVTYIK